MKPDLELLRRRLAGSEALRVEGRVTGVVGVAIHAVVPGVRVGERVTVERAGSEALPAEVVGFDDARAVLLPLGETVGVGVDDVVRPSGARLRFACGEGVLGRVLDGLGRPCDGGGALAGPLVEWEVDRAPPEALRRQRVSEVLPLGIRVMDGLLTAGAGQRVGLFAAAGAGKSTLLGQIARQCAADVVVIALVGERGREVREFLEDALGPAGRARASVVVATSDAPALVRVRSALVATAVAEYFRERGARVLLLMDSITRVARAQREVGLAAGEAPVRRGYPPSVFALLPRLLERAGPGERGSITGVYTVLVEGGDLEEPIADEVRGILDGHVVLDRAVGARGRWPAVDVLQSLSRVMDRLVTPEQRAAAARLRRLVAAFEARRDLIALGAYAPGSDRATDEALARIDAIELFLRQGTDERSAWADTLRALADAVR